MMETPETAQFPITYYIYIFIALVAVGMCILTGVIICCVFKLILRWKKGSLRESNVNREYYEVIDPIYEAVSTVTVVDSNHSEAQIKVKNNDAYKSIKLNERSSCASLGIDIENSINVLQMEHNKSYQVAPGLSMLTTLLFQKGLLLHIHRNVIKFSLCVMTKMLNKQRVVKLRYTLPKMMNKSSIKTRESSFLCVLLKVLTWTAVQAVSVQISM